MSELSDLIRAVNEHFFVPEPEQVPETAGALLYLFKRIADTSDDDMARVEALATLGTILGIFGPGDGPADDPLVTMH